MKTHNLQWSPERGLTVPEGLSDGAAHFVVFFGSRAALSDGVAYSAMQTRFPNSDIIGCTTGGQFDRDTIEDDTVFATAVQFDRARCRLTSGEIAHAAQSEACGERIGTALVADDLRAVLVISDGLSVNGSELVAGVTRAVGAHVTVSGGLAGDGAEFEKTLVAANCAPRSGLVAAIGFYGEALEVGTGSAGGWDAFGPRRSITRSAGNVLYELDGEPALDLYERYLGEDDVKSLPGSALLFPLRIDDPKVAGRDVMRTILAIDREARSMTFAGDVPQGWTAQLMRGNFERLTEGAADAASQSSNFTAELEGFSLLVSCIGRRLLMGQRAIDEVDAAAEVISRKHAMIGFYSYGEISPHARSGFCQLHNQTMTVFSLQERMG